MLSICYITNSRIPSARGNSYQTLSMVKAFSDAGVQITLLSPERFDLDDKVFSGIPPANHVKLWCFDFPALKCVSKKAWSRLHRVTFFLSVLNFLRQYKFDLIFTRSEIVALGLCKLKFTFGKQLVLYESHAFSRKLFEVYRKSFAVVTINEPMARRVKKFVPTSNVLVCHDACDETWISESSSVAKENIRFALVYVGSLSTKGLTKGVEQIISAKENALSLFDEISLYGISQHEVAQASIDVGSQGSTINFAGRIGHEDIPKIISRYSFGYLNFPRQYHYLYNCSPLKLFEYLACGLIPICPYFPSFRSILDKVYWVEISEFNNPFSLSVREQILRYRNNPAELQKARAHNLKMAEDLTWGIRARKILDVAC